MDINDLSETDLAVLNIVYRVEILEEELTEYVLLATVVKCELASSCLSRMLEKVFAGNCKVSVPDCEGIVRGDVVIIIATVLAKTVHIVTINRLVKRFED